jgi:hypothetical protein
MLTQKGVEKHTFLEGEGGWVIQIVYEKHPYV